MVTKEVIVHKIEQYLNGELSARDLDTWALDILVRQREDDSLEGIVLGEAISLLNMLHDEDEKFRPSNNELKDMRDILLGTKEYQITKLIRKDFTRYCEEVLRTVGEVTSCLSRTGQTNVDELVGQCKRSDAGTIHGLLLRHVASLLDLATTARRSGLTGRYVVPDLSDEALQVPLAEITRQLQDVHHCLTGQRAFVLTIVGKAEGGMQPNIVIS